MNPEENLRSSSFYVQPCPLADAQSLTRAYHYSKGGSVSAIYTHGLYRRSDSMLMGIAWWTPPTKDTAMTVNPVDWRRVLNLSRLAVVPEAPRNSASFLLGKSIRLIQKDARFLSLITYADEAQGHNGGIYRATNWLYMGRVGPHQRWEDPANGNRQVSNVHKNSQLMYAAGYIQVSSFYKHKYILHLHQQKEKAKVSQLFDLVVPLESLSYEELTERLRQTRESRENIRPARQKHIVKEKKKVTKKKSSAAEKLLSSLSPDDLAALLQEMSK